MTPNPSIERTLPGKPVIALSCQTLGVMDPHMLMNDDLVPVWQRVNLTENGEVMSVARPVPFISKDQQSLYPYRVVLEYEYAAAGSTDVPTPEQWLRIESYEKAIQAAVAPDPFGLLALTLVSDGLCQIVVYVKERSSGQTKAVMALPIEEPESPVVIGYSVTPDPEWNYATVFASEGLPP